MIYKPHDYQQYATNYILEHPIAAVILGMGLGKTSITLTAIEQLMYDSFEVSKVLVVAPLRVARNTWSDEIHKWEHLKHLRYSIVLGTAADRKKALAAEADIYVINRENLQWLVEQSGVPFDFDMVVLDELSSFKNWNSKRFKAFMKVRPKVKRVIGLTGTPSSNGLMDLFAEFKCLDMGERLGRFISQYRVNYFVPDQMNGQIVYSYKLRKGAEEQIYDKISDITISMKALDHLKMPELISNEYPVYLSEAEEELYSDMAEDLFLPLKGGEVTAANAAALSGKLMQMANGAVYSDDGDEIQIHDQKLDALEDLIEAANGKPIMVAYWFKHDLARIMRRLSERKIPFEKLDSEESIRKWNREELPVALIHPASAGHGLNLQSGGNMLIWFGLTWSLELYQQTVARLWRQGQAAETVVVQHIITAGTIDEQVMKALESKDRTQSALINAVKEYLSQAYKIDNDINSKLEQVASLRDLATKATSTMSDMPGSPNRNIHKMEDAIVKIIALEDEINSDIHELISLKADITHMIKRVANRAERTILEKRYLCFDTWEQISVDMGYSIQHTFRLHDKALKEIDGFLKVES